MEVGHHQSGPRFGDAAELGVGRPGIGQMTDHQAAPQDVEASVRQRQVAHVADQGLESGAAASLAKARVQHLGAKVDPDREGGAGSVQSAAGPATGVQQAHARQGRGQVRGQPGFQVGDGGLVGVARRPQPIAFADAQGRHVTTP